MLRAGLPVELVEADDARAASARERIVRLLGDDPAAPARRLTVGTDVAAAVRAADLVIEAVAEDAAVKRSVFHEIGRVAKSDAVLATNTSSLSVADLAVAAGDASHVIGLHFFNPVSRMALVEVARAAASSDDAVATAVAFAASLGKTPVVVADTPGFVVNRLLMPALSEAVRAAAEGADVATVDANVRAWGLPMGPFELMDTIGLDVIGGIFAAISPHLGDRVDPMPAAMSEAVAAGAAGRKSGRGFYEWAGERAAPPNANENLLRAVRGGAAANGEVDVSAERFVLLMCNEAARALEEGVVATTDAIDLATLLGLGLAPFRGGIARFVDNEGTDEIVRALEQLSERHGERFAPAPLLVRAADAGETLSSFGGGAK